MFSYFRKSRAYLSDSSFMTLWFEQLLFSVLYAIAFHSWIVFVVMFISLSLLLNKLKGKIYMIYVISCLWGFIAFSIGYSINCGWATGLGGAFVLLGIKAHISGLKKLVVNKPASLNNIDWLRNGYERRQNLN